MYSTLSTLLKSVSYCDKKDLFLITKTPFLCETYSNIYRGTRNGNKYKFILCDPQNVILSFDESRTRVKFAYIFHQS